MKNANGLRSFLDKKRCSTYQLIQMESLKITMFYTANESTESLGVIEKANEHT